MPCIKLLNNHGGRPTWNFDCWLLTKWNPWKLNQNSRLGWCKICQLNQSVSGYCVLFSVKTDLLFSVHDSFQCIDIPSVTCSWLLYTAHISLQLYCVQTQSTELPRCTWQGPVIKTNIFWRTRSMKSTKVQGCTQKGHVIKTNISPVVRISENPLVSCAWSSICARKRSLEIFGISWHFFNPLKYEEYIQKLKYAHYTA